MLHIQLAQIITLLILRNSPTTVIVHNLDEDNRNLKKPICKSEKMGKNVLSKVWNCCFINTFTSITKKQLFRFSVFLLFRTIKQWRFYCFQIYLYIQIVGLEVLYNIDLGRLRNNSLQDSAVLFFPTSSWNKYRNWDYFI